jgi:hypothetical protein
VTGIVIIYSAVMSSLHIGTFSFKNGNFLLRMALTYKDALKMLPVVVLTKSAKMIGRNKFTFSVVSNIMTAKENDNLE